MIKGLDEGVIASRGVRAAIMLHVRALHRLFAHQDDSDGETIHSETASEPESVCSYDSFVVEDADPPRPRKRMRLRRLDDESSSDESLSDD